MKTGADKNDLLNRLKTGPLLAGVDFDAVLDRAQFIGRAPQQVDEFFAEEIEPIRLRYPHLFGQSAN